MSHSMYKDISQNSKQHLFLFLPLKLLNNTNIKHTQLLSDDILKKNNNKKKTHKVKPASEMLIKWDTIILEDDSKVSSSRVDVKEWRCQHFIPKSHLRKQR